MQLEAFERSVQRLAAGVTVHQIVFKRTASLNARAASTTQLRSSSRWRRCPQVAEEIPNKVLV